MVVGQAQITYRDGNPVEPVDAMAQAAELALADAGAAGLRRRVQKVGTPVGISPYRDAGRLVAAELGCGEVVTATTPFGGNAVYDLLTRYVTEIQAGTLDVALVCAAETLRTRRADRQAGYRDRYRKEPPEARADEVVDCTGARGYDHWWLGTWSDAALFYGLVEVAIRHRNGESPDGHLRRVTELWSKFAEVAAADPAAWIRDAPSADVIATASPANRPVAYPYRKLMTANPDVDQASAVVLCSAAVARELNVPRDRWVFPWAGSGASDHDPVIRRHLEESPALRIAGATALGLAGLGIDDCALLDVYACFPSAVQVATRELGISPERVPTVTGGSTFHGGPPNSYGLHAAARVVELLRCDPSQRALISGIGGLLDHHSVLILAGAPPAKGFRYQRPVMGHTVPQARARPTSVPPQGQIESYTIDYDRESNPGRALVSCLTDRGGRVWAEMTDPAHLGQLASGDVCGRRVALAATAEPGPLARLA